MNSLKRQKIANIRKTWTLMIFFLCLVIAVGWGFSRIYGNPGILYFAVAFSLLMNIIGYWFSDKIVLAMHRARRVDPAADKDIYALLKNLSGASGLPMPKFFIINDSAPNAFATGRNAKHASVAATTGLLERLDKGELEGVLAHEISHIGNRDMLVSTVAVVLVGFVTILSDMFMRSLWFGGLRRDDDRNSGGVIMIIGIASAILAPIFASLIHLAVSRQREFLADASAAYLTHHPERLASALRKISDFGTSLRTAGNSTAHLFFANPFGADNPKGSPRAKHVTSRLAKLFMTHPPIEERIQALEKLRV